MTPGSILSEEFTALQRAVAGRYVLVREIGRGEIGIVFLARDLTLDRLVAIKTLQPNHACLPDVRVRFVQTARRAAQLAHPNIVRVHAVETTGDCDYVVTDYIGGESLADRLRRVKLLTPEEVSRIMQESAWALSHAHARGVIHGRLHAANILLEPESGRALVADFATVDVSSRDHDAPDSVSSDIRALGAVGWLAIVGEPHSSSSALPDATPRALRDAIRRAMTGDATAAWTGADAMAQALATTKATSASVPPMLGAFARELLEDGTRLTMFASVGAVAGVVHKIYFVWWNREFFGKSGWFSLNRTHAWLDFTGMELVAFAYIAITLTLVVAIGTLLRIRRISVAGFRRSLALAAVEDIEREELDLSRGRRSLPWWDNAVVVTVAAIVVTTLGAVGINFAGFLGGRWSGDIGGLFLALLVDAVAISSGVLLIRWWLRRFRHRTGLWVRFWKGPAGRWLWRLARLGLGRVQPAVRPGEPTTIVLGQAIAHQLAALDAGRRQQLQSVSGLTATFGRLAERGDTEDRVEAVRAMEAIRLDLIDLRAGRKPVSAVAAELEQLQDVARRVDAALRMDRR